MTDAVHDASRATSTTPIGSAGIRLGPTEDVVPWMRVLGVTREVYPGEDRPFDVVVLRLADEGGVETTRVLRWDDAAHLELLELLHAAGLGLPPSSAIDFRRTLWPSSARSASAADGVAVLGDDPAFRSFVESPAFAEFLARSAVRVRERRRILRRGTRALRIAVLATVAASIAAALFALRRSR